MPLLTALIWIFREICMQRFFFLLREHWKNIFYDYQKKKMKYFILLKGQSKAARTEENE